MRRNLTERFVQTLKPKPGKKKITVFDAKTTGLAVIVEGDARTYKVMTRDPAGKQRWAEVKDGIAARPSILVRPSPARSERRAASLIGIRTRIGTP